MTLIERFQISNGGFMEIRNQPIIKKLVRIGQDLPILSYHALNKQDVNFGIFRRNMQDFVAGKRCIRSSDQYNCATHVECRSPRFTPRSTPYTALLAKLAESEEVLMEVGEAAAKSRITESEAAVLTLLDKSERALRDRVAEVEDRLTARLDKEQRTHGEEPYSAVKHCCSVVLDGCAVVNAVVVEDPP
eukprot:634102-Prorocentrum_minimum.AAC.1